MRPALLNVRVWHFSEVPPRLAHVGYRGQSGRHVLGVSFSQFDPELTPKR